MPSRRLRRRLESWDAPVLLREKLSSSPIDRVRVGVRLLTPIGFVLMRCSSSLRCDRKFGLSMWGFLSIRVPATYQWDELRSREKCRSLIFRYGYGCRFETILIVKCRSLYDSRWKVKLCPDKLRMSPCLRGLKELPNLNTRLVPPGHMC